MGGLGGCLRERVGSFGWGKVVCCVLEPGFPSYGGIDSGRADCGRIGDILPLGKAKRGKAALKGWFVSSCFFLFSSFFLFVVFFFLFFFFFFFYFLFFGGPCSERERERKKERKKESMVGDEKEREGRGIKNVFFSLLFFLFLEAVCFVDWRERDGGLFVFVKERKKGVGKFGGEGGS